MRPVSQHLIEKLRLQGRSMVDADGRVVVEVPCRGCGYNLRGIAADGGCPECGHAVADALRDDRPEFSDPKWLRRVVLGGKLFVAAFVGFFVPFVFAILFSWAADTGMPYRLVKAGESLRLALFGVVLGLACAGVWCITARDAARGHIRSEAGWRWAARVSSILLVPGVLVAFSGYDPNTASLLRIKSVWLSTSALPLLLGLAAITLMMYLRTLARRMAEWKLVRSITTVCYGLGGCTAVFLAAAVMVYLWGAGPILLIAGVSGLCIGGLAIWAVILLDETRRHLNAAQALTASEP